MRQKQIARIIIFVLVFAFIGGALQVAYSAYTDSTKVDMKKDNKSNIVENKPNKDKREDTEPLRGFSTENLQQSVNIDKETIDISDVTVSQEIESKIKVREGKNASKYINNMKKLVKKLNVPKRHNDEISKLLDQGYSTTDIMIAYEFLYDNYGQIGDLKKILNSRKSGKDFAQIFEEYETESKEFVPRNFESGYLENLLNSGLTSDDIMIADRISQKGFKTFEELIELRREKSWSEIKSDLGIVNTEEKLPRVSITDQQIKKYVKESGLSEEKVIEALVVAAKIGEDDSKAISKAKSGKNKREIMAELLEEEYK